MFVKCFLPMSYSSSSQVWQSRPLEVSQANFLGLVPVAAPPLPSSIIPWFLSFSVCLRHLTIWLCQNSHPFHPQFSKSHWDLKEQLEFNFLHEKSCFYWCSPCPSPPLGKNQTFFQDIYYIILYYINIYNINFCIFVWTHLSSLKAGTISCSFQTSPRFVKVCGPEY